MFNSRNLLPYFPPCHELYDELKRPQHQHQHHHYRWTPFWCPHLARQSYKCVVLAVQPRLLRAHSSIQITRTHAPAQTPSPVSANSKNGVPEIGGSEGGASRPCCPRAGVLNRSPPPGFIGLVVGLGIIVIASCVGVFFLLKHRGGGGSKRHAPTVGGAVEMDFPAQGRLAGTFGGRARGGWGRADSLGEYGPVDESGDIADEGGRGWRDYKRALEDGTVQRQASISSAASTVRLEPLRVDPAARKLDDQGPAIDSPEQKSGSPKPFEPTHGRRATDESTLVSPTSIAHPYGVGGSKFHEVIT